MCTCSSFALPCPRLQTPAGFTLVESVIVLLLLSILSIYALPKLFNTGTATLKSQAETLASNLQRAQLIATTRGSNVYVCTVSGGYALKVNPNLPSTPDPYASICTDATVVPETSESVSVTLTAPTGSPLYFNSLGSPYLLGSAVTASATFGLSTSEASYSVAVTPVSGLVSIATP
jgi:MSHA pilin protein MshC